MSKEERKRITIDACRGKRVLHLGCTDWPFTAEKIRTNELLHAEIAEVAESVVGVDLSQEGLDLLAECNREWELVYADACTYVPDREFDLVVASEIIEHLENPGQLLRGIAAWASPSTALLITTNNSQSLKSALRAIFGREECHPDHTVLFSTATLTNLLDRTGWNTEGVQYYRVAAQSPLMRCASGCMRTLELFGSPRMREGLIAYASLKAETVASRQPFAEPLARAS